MNEKVKGLFSEAKSAEEIIKIAEECGYVTEIIKNNKLSEADFCKICGGTNTPETVDVDYYVVVIDEKTNEILYMCPY